MTKTQIKAELRRSACEDDDPYMDIRTDAFNYARSFSNFALANLTTSGVRTFYLLVAEAME